MPFDYQDNYHRELALRSELRGAVSTPLGILTLLGSLVGFMLQRFRFEQDFVGFLFGALILAAIFGIAIAAYFLVRAMHGHTYKHIECAIGLRQHHQELRDWHAQYGQGHEGADADFAAYLEEAYASAGDHNARLNESRSAAIFLAHRMMIFSGIFAGAAFLPFGYAMHGHPKEPVHVVIIRDEQPTKKQDQEVKKMAEEQKPAPATPVVPSVPPKPQGPPLRDIRENHQPREKK